MSAAIQQIQATFSPTEDRILLKLHTGEHSLQAWLTRRYVKLLIPALHGQHPQTGEPLFSPSKQALVAMSSQKIQQEGNYEAPYEEPETVTKPLGEHPILLVKMTFKDMASDNPQIVLEPEAGKGIVLSYRAELMGALLKILQQAMSQAEWNLEMPPILELPPANLLH